MNVHIYGWMCACTCELSTSHGVCEVKRQPFGGVSSLLPQGGPKSEI